jgi:hypothetical protein
MFRGALLSSASRGALLQPRVLQHRKLNVHEYCGMELLAKHGVPVPENKLCKVSSIQSFPNLSLT